MNPEKEQTITMIIDMLGASITELSSEIKKLEEKINPILRPSSPVNELKDVNNTNGSSIAKTLHEYRNRVGDNILQINNLLVRCEL